MIGVIEARGKTCKVVQWQIIPDIKGGYMGFSVNNNVRWVGKIDWELRKFHGNLHGILLNHSEISGILPLRA